MAVNTIFHQQNTTADSSRKQSPAIWGDCPWLAILEDPGVGYGHFDDFMCAYDAGTITSVTNIGPYEMFGESGGSITGAVNVLGGALNLVAGTTGDADVIVTLGGGAPFVIASAAASARKLWFEARIKISSIADDIGSFFIGLAEEDRAAAAGLITATQGTTVDSALADIDMLGFWHPDTDAALVHVAYGKASATAQKLTDSFHTMVADTFFKVGFKFDPAAPTTERIKFYLNNVESSTYVTATQLEASTFPDGEELTLVAGVVNDDGSTDFTMAIDWWKIAQLT